MDIRHLATKSFDNGINAKRSLVYTGAPLCIPLSDIEIPKNDPKNYETEEVSLSVPAKTPQELQFSEIINKGRRELTSSPISDIVSYGGEILPLSQIYNFSVKAGDYFNQNGLYVGTTFEDMIENDDIKNYMRDIAVNMFGNINPYTREADVRRSAYYTHLIPLIVCTGVMTPQTDGAGSYFNPNGTVSVAEFLDGLNATKFGANSNHSRKKTLDRISNENDYFNEGYQDCVRGISSPFFNLYTRKELIEPITRLELAYITVICWNSFLEKYNNLFGGNYYLGINFDWENPADFLSRFDDGFDYKISKCIANKDYDVVSLNIKDYKGSLSMRDYKTKMKDGTSAIPLPMFMSMIELDLLNLFNYEGSLEPMKEVSRGELCYFLSNIARLFQTSYVK